MTEVPTIADKWSYALELEGRRVELEEGESTLGRSRSCTITLRDPSASRNHALIVVAPGEVRARDLQSSNGTYLNGERLYGERVVTDGDRITIGETDIVVRIVAPVSEDVGATVRLDSARLQCPACGAELPVHAETCSRCGHRLAGEPEAAAAAALAPGNAGGPLGGTPPPPALPQRTEIYRDDEPVVPSGAEAARAPRAAAPATSEGGELLPPIGEEILRPGPKPALPPPPPPPPRVPAPRPPAPPPRATPNAPTPGPAPLRATAYRPAGFWIRVVAALIDGIWMMLLVLLLTLPFGGPLQPNGQLVGTLSWLLLLLGSHVLGWAVVGATPGKLVLGLRVITAGRRRGIGFGRALMRLCGWWLSGALLGIGHLLAAFNRDKRALHDLLAETAVMRR